MIPLRPDQIVQLLSHECEKIGSQSEWARKHGIAVSQVCEALSGKRTVSASIINALGYIQVDRYIPAGRGAA